MIDDVFAVIADQTRRQILRALSSGTRPVGELVEELGVSQPTVSKHLKVLRNAGLVETEAAGQKRLYSLTPEPLHKVSLWIEALTQAAEKSAELAQSQQKETPEVKTVPVAEAVPSAQPVQEQISQELQEEQEKEASSQEEKLEPAKTEPVQPETSQEGEEKETSPSAAISFTPLMPFTPSGFTSSSEDEQAPDESGQEEEDSTSSLESREEQEKEQTPLVAIFSKKTQEEGDQASSEPEDKLELQEEQAGDDSEGTTELAEAQPEQEPEQEKAELPYGYEYISKNSRSTDSEEAATLPALPSAAPESSEQEQENRGLLAAISRWGRRRSR